MLQVRVFEQHGRDGRHDPYRGHLLAFHQFAESLHGKGAVQHDLLRAVDGDEGLAPAVDVEHGGVQQRHRAFAQARAEAVGDIMVRRVADGELRHHVDRQQVELAMREGGAFWLARGAGGVAQRGVDVLVQHGPVDGVGLAGDQRFVLDDVGDAGRRQARLVRHIDHQLDHILDLVVDAFEQRHQRVVDKEDLILRMPDGVDDVLRRKPDIDRVQRGADACHAVVQLKVAVGVERHRGDALARLPGHAGEYLELAAQAVGQLRHAPIPLHPGKAEIRPGDVVAVDDTDLVGVHAHRPLHDRGEHKRVVRAEFWVGPGCHPVS